MVVPGSDAGGARKSYDVTFSVCSSAGESCNDNHLNDVSHVVYRFDKRWFSVPDVTAANEGSGFSYTVRVWGITSVGACIFIKGAPDDPIARAGRIVLGADQPVFWGSETSDGANNCSDVLPNRKRESLLDQP
jgi:hypothetical protein